MDSDSDDYDYLFYLKSGFNSDKSIEKSSVDSVIESVDIHSDINSDTYDTDSDDCIIIECNDKNDNNADNNHNKLTNHSKNGENNTQDLDKKLNSFAEVIQLLKAEVDTKTTPLKEESIDVKPDIKPDIKAPDFDIKPFVLKIENGVKKEESLESEPIKSKNNESTGSESTESNVESIDSRDLDDKSRNGDEGSTTLDDRFCPLLSIIAKIRSERQKPTFDRILGKFKRSVDESNPIYALNLLISDAIERNLIEKIAGIDEKDVSYRTVTIQTSKRRKTSKSTESVSKESVKCCEELSTDSVNTHECNQNSKLESLALEGYTDISDIDISSAQKLFGDTELNPEIFNLYPESTKQSPTSFSLSSNPIKSFNHNRNKEVIRKQLIAPTPDTAHDIDIMLSLKDYRNWLLEPLPRISPFFPQKGDRVVYLRDAHQIYIDYELKELGDLYQSFRSTPELIKTAINSDDYVINAIITEVKFYQINYIKFSVIQLESPSNENRFKFNVLYRPNRGINDFLILEDTYRASQLSDWKIGDEFRSLWKKSWWCGTIVSKSVFNSKYPNSLFKCYKIMWYTQEKGRLSPWDLFPVDPNRLPKRKENGVLIILEDMLNFNYTPRCSEWPQVYDLAEVKWRCYECKRIYLSIKFVEKNVSQNIVSILKGYQNPEISYPVNLQLIKERLKNIFYRRKETLIQDITYLKTNAKLYVQKSDLKNCEDFVDLLLNIANDCQSIKVEHFEVHLNKYSHLKHNSPQFTSNNPSIGSEQSYDPSIASSSSMPNISDQNQINPISPKKKSKRKRSAPDTCLSTANSEVKVTESTQWKVDSQKFIDDFFKHEDSQPYREAVDEKIYPYYYKVITEPIHLSNIQGKLSLDQYPNPIEMRKDFRLMFENAKAFSKDPKSKMRIINKSLYHLSEDRLREIIVDWERVYAYEQKKLKTSGFKVREPISRHQLWGYGYQQYY